MASSAYSALPTTSSGLDDPDGTASLGFKAKMDAGLLSLLATLADRPALPKTIMIIFVVIDLLQLLVIPLSPAQGMTWNDQPIMSSIYKFLLSVNLLPRPEGSPIYNASSLVIASLVIAAIFSSFFLWLWLSEAFSAPGTAHSQWRSRIIWWFFPVLAYALWTPFVGGLIAPFSCLTIGGGSASAVWMNTTITCFSGPHIGMLVSGVFILFAFCGTMMLLTVTLVDRRTTIAGKDNEVAAVHGRVDAALLFVKLILAAFFVLGFGSNPWITVIISLLAGLVWLGLYTYYLPYYRLSMNQVQAGASAVFLCAGVAAALSVAVGASSSNSGVILFLFLLLPVGYSAISLVLLRWRSLSILTDLSSPFLIELKARSIIVDFIEPVVRSQLSSRSGRGDWSLKSSQGSARSGAVGSKAADMVGAPPSGSVSSRSGRRHGSSAAGSRNGGDDDGQSVQSGASEKQSVNGSSIRGGSASHRGGGYDSTAMDIEAAAAGAEGIATIGDAFARVDALWTEGSRTFNSSPVVDVFAAQYLGGLRGNNHLERLHLKAGAKKAGTWSIDVRFFAYQRQQQLISADMDASSNKMTVERRIELEDLLELSRVQVDTTRSLVLVFWEALAQKRPDLTKLQHTGVSINNALVDTEATFRRLMTLAPQSATVMRAYADFLLELANDPKRGVELIDDAEQIEDEQSRAHANTLVLDDDIVMGSACTFDLAADSLPMIRVSADPDSVGVITNLNGPAQKLLGYTSRELVGRDIATVIPEPIASIHNQLLDRYINDGKERMIGSSRILFFQQRSGIIVPVKMSNAKSITGDEWFSVAEEMRTNWSFVFFGSMEQSWAITALCKSAQALLGIDPLALRGGGMTLSSFVDDVEDLMAQCEANPDKSVCVSMHLGKGASNTASSHHNSNGKHQRHRNNTSSSSSSSASTTEFLVSARLQSFYVPFLDQPFFILKFKKASEADKATMMMSEHYGHSRTDDDDGDRNSVDSFGERPAKKTGILSPKNASGKEGFGFRKQPRSPSNKASRGKVSFGKATALDETSSPTHKPEAAPFNSNDNDSTDAARDSINGGDDSGRIADSDEDNEGREILRPPTPPHASHSLASGRSGGRSPHGGKGLAAKGDVSLCPFFNPAAPSSSTSGPKTPNSVSSRSLARSAPVNASHHASAEPMPVAFTSTGSEGEAHSDGRLHEQRVNSEASIPGSVNSDAGEEDEQAKAETKLQAKDIPSKGLAAPPGLVITNQAIVGMASPFTTSLAATNIATTVVTDTDAVGASTGLELVPVAPDSNKSNGKGKGKGRASVTTLQLNPAGAIVETKADKKETKSAKEEKTKALGSPRASPEGGAKGPGSVHSKGSKGSGGSGTSVSDILRRGVIAKGKRLESSLVLLNRAIILAFVIVGLMNIASLVVTTILYNQLIANFDRVHGTAARGLALQRIYGDTQSLQLHNRGSSVLPANGTIKIQSLLTNVRTFERESLDLYAKLDDQVEDEVFLYTGPSIPIDELLVGTFTDYDTFNSTKSMDSLMNIGADLVARARRIANGPISAITESLPDAFFVVYNGYNPIRVAANNSIVLADSRSAAQASTIEQANYVVLAIGIAILALIAAAVITPAVFRVLTAKQAIMDIFLEVPLTVIKALRARTQKRVTAAALEADGEDVAVDLDGTVGNVMTVNNADEDDGLAAVALAAAGGRVDTRDRAGSFGSRATGDNNSDIDGQSRTNTTKGSLFGGLGSAPVAPDASLTAAETTAASTTKPHKRGYSRSASQRTKLLLALLWPIFLYIAYFAGTYVWKQNTVVYSRYARSEVFNSVQMEFFVRQLNFNLRLTLAYSAPKFVEDQVTRTRRGIQKVKSLSNALLYGDATLMTRATLQVIPAANRLWTEYACFDNNGFYYQVPDCEAYHDGVLAKSGLLGAVSEYLANAKVLADFSEANPTATVSLTTGGALLSQLYGTTYLPPAVGEYSNIVYTSAVDTLTQFNTLNLVVTIGSCLVLVLLYYIIYRPQVKKLDKEIKNVRNLLLLFPDEVSRNTQAIIAAGRDMMKDASSQAGSGASVVSGGASVSYGTNKSLALRRR